MSVIRSKINGRFIRNLEDIECPICKKVFSPRTHKTICCSYKCSAKYRVNKYHPKVKKKCKFCNKEFVVEKHMEKIQFCSRDCYYESMIGLTGDKSNGWQGGKTKINQSIRSSRKYKEWRKLVFERDGYTCKICGGKEKIQADHIKPFSIIIKENYINNIKQAKKCDELWDVNNGRTLCEECHKKTDTYLVNLTINEYKQLCHI